MPNTTVAGFDPAGFQREIFHSKANLLASLVVRDSRFQGAEEVGKLIHDSARQWGMYAGVGGVGQYSLCKNQPVLAVARFNTIFREATKGEVQRDVSELGDQVFGPPLKEATEEQRKRPTFHFLGEEFTYSGPERFAESVFTTKIMQVELIPRNIKTIVDELDKASPTGKLTSSQGYQMYFAKNGQLLYAAFMKPEGLVERPPISHGKIEIKGNSMEFMPNEKTRIDYSALLLKST
jgi:hypothetical protein